MFYFFGKIPSPRNKLVTSTVTNFSNNNINNSYKGENLKLYKTTQQQQWQIDKNKDKLSVSIGGKQLTIKRIEKPTNRNYNRYIRTNILIDCKNKKKLKNKINKLLLLYFIELQINSIKAVYGESQAEMKKKGYKSD